MESHTYLWNRGKFSIYQFYSHLEGKKKTGEASTNNYRSWEQIIYRKINNMMYSITYVNLTMSIFLEKSLIVRGCLDSDFFQERLSG